MEKDKEYFRKKFIRERNSLSEEERRKANALIKKKLFESKSFKTAKTVMFYVSFGSEVDTYSMIEDALKMGKRVVVPVVEMNKHKIKAVQLKNIKKDLVPGCYGIYEPRDRRKSVKPCEIDIVIVPGVAFDVNGYRIGYGGGYYDRWLKRIPFEKRIGIAFSCQIIDSLPHNRYDIPVGCVVTEKYIFGKSDLMEGVKG